MDYETFFKMFLVEMPWQVPGSNDFAAQLEMLNELISYDYDLSNISPNVFKIQANEQITYWYGNADASNVSMIVDTIVSGSFCKITMTSKNPAIPPKSPPFASDMYMLIKKDLANDSLVFTSDGIMTDDAIKLWSRMASMGHTISVFNTATHQYELSAVTTPEELTTFIGDSEKQKYIFVLSESHINYVGTRHAVGIMEIKRKSGYPLTEMFARFKANLNKGK